MKSILMISVLILVAMSGMASADVQTGWPMDTLNTHQDPHIIIDFDNGTCGENVTSPTNKVTFDNGGVNPWIYACKNCSLNIYDPVNYPWGAYVVNGNCGSWCNIPGHHGNISFKHDVGHVSVLVSTASGLQMDAYNESGVLVATSGWAYGNLGTRNFTRISVDRPSDCDISYVCIHDTGNYWLIDDLLITHKRGEGGIAHCQKFIHGQGQDHWNESSWMDKKHPCE